MKAIICLLAAVAVVAASSSSQQHWEMTRESGAEYTFERYVKDFGKKYEKHAHAFHAKVFADNFARIKQHNSDETQTWKMAVNKFTDLTTEQRRRFLGSSVTAAADFAGERRQAQLPPVDIASLPTSVDWRNVQPSIITPVKDQGGCGSCWAHGSVECIESYAAMASGTLLKLSRQNLVDCTPNPNQCGGTGGCLGATAELAFDYVEGSGVATEAAYPYKGATGTCNTNVQKSATVGGWEVLQNNNYTQIVQAVATIGPLAINADASEWFSYSSGVFTGCTFANIDINHVIQLVGYGTDSASGMDYWLVRNSWSANWGESGYIRIQRHSDGGMENCGPDTKPGDGVGCNGGPSVVTVCGSCGIWYDTSYPTGANIIS